ncbi:MAG: PaaI family thioesterase [Bacillota bacterium]
MPNFRLMRIVHPHPHDAVRSTVHWTPGCFVCGRENTAGLQAVVVTDGTAAYLRVTLADRFVGIPGSLHGGVIAAALDEAMWYAAYRYGIPSVTGSLEIRFVRPGVPGKPLLAVAWVETKERPAAGQQGIPDSGRIGRAVARLLDVEGRIVAAARGRFVRVPVPDAVHRVLRSEPAAPDVLDDIARWPGLDALRGRITGGP